MEGFFVNYGGTALAILGAALAVGLCCIGSARGTGMVGEAAAGLVSEKPELSTKCLVLQVLPGTQGLYGLVAWFFAMLNMGMFAGDIAQLNLAQGLTVFVSCLPIALGGWLSACFQARVAAASINILAKQPKEFMKGVIFCGIVEFYAIISLIATIMLLLNVL